jgi:murein DD-endopeptidase MepM/ murein hydrolase activator NlpD
MIRNISIILLFVLFPPAGIAQTRSDLEDRRKKALEEISYVDEMLKSTARQKAENMNEVKIIGRKLDLRENVIQGMKQEISLIMERIDLNTIALEMMEDDLQALKDDYARAIVNSYRAKKFNTELVYVLSAQDFNQGYKRFKYLQQTARFRRQEAELISELKVMIEDSKEKLQQDFIKLSSLKSREELQKNLLKNEQEKKQSIVKTLGNKEKQLRADLEEKKRIAKKIEKEIEAIIEEEKAKYYKVSETPDQKLISENFADNKGRLPWPVERGIVTAQFGVRPHPVLKHVTEDNVGIEITSSGTTKARAIFRGEVVRVFPIKGANMTVIIKHGKYFTAYQNIVETTVKPLDKVDVYQQIGTVYADQKEDNKAVLKFMIFMDKERLDPEVWLSKK